MSGSLSKGERSKGNFDRRMEQGGVGTGFKERLAVSVMREESAVSV